MGIETIFPIHGSYGYVVIVVSIVRTDSTGDKSGVGAKRIGISSVLPLLFHTHLNSIMNLPDTVLGDPMKIH